MIRTFLTTLAALFGLCIALAVGALAAFVVALPLELLGVPDWAYTPFAMLIGVAVIITLVHHAVEHFE